MDLSTARRFQARLVAWLVPGALHYPTEHRQLRLLWLDGVAGNVAEAMVVSYAGLYLLSLGASKTEIGFQAALLNLMAALAFFPGARLVERWGRRKPLVVLSGGVAARLAVLGLALVPFVSRGPELILAITLCVAVRGFFNSLANPAWTSLIADLVPLRLRGRYLASRQFGMAIAALGANILAGQAIVRLGAPAGYQWSFLVAFLIGLAATNFFARIPEPAPHTDPVHAAAAPASPIDPAARRNFRYYVLAQFIWGLSLQISSPFFNIYIVEGLRGTPADVGWLQAIQILAMLVGLRYFGSRTDRRGPRWTVRTTGLLIPFLPWLWTLFQAPWQVIFAQIPSGFLWAGYELGNFALLLAITPHAQRARLVATYQTIMFTTAFVGPLIGGVLVPAVGYRLVFFVSGLGRLVAMFVFTRLVQEPGRLESDPRQAALQPAE